MVSADAAVGLVDEDAGVGQRRAVALGAGGQEHRRGRAGLADAHGVHGRAEELHGVVHREQRGHVAAGRVDVEADRPVHVLALEVQELGDDQVGHVLVQGGAQEHDPLPQQPGVDVVGPFAPVGGLDDGGDEHAAGSSFAQPVGCESERRGDAGEAQL